MENRQNRYDEVCNILDNMRSNSYLVPTGFTDLMHFTDDTMDQYKTYCDDSRNYICVYLYRDYKELYSFNCSRRGDRWEISIDGYLFISKLNAIKEQENNVHMLLKRIYNEIHSLKKDNQVIKEIKKEIKMETERLNVAKERIADLKKRVQDANLLTKSNQ